MTTEEEYLPNVIGEIDDGPFGKVPLYLALLPSEVRKVYDWRQQNGLAESDDGTDEFFFMCPNDAFGTEGTSMNYSVNNVSKSGNLFVKPKLGEEYFVLSRAFFHLAGVFYEPVTSKDLGYKSSFDEVHTVYFNLPKIPYEIIVKMDTFFRDVDKKYGTEGIVLLTYDFDFKDSDDSQLGWGFGVPHQKNTGTHCDYDKSNVIGELSASTRIVGTVHSHPKMPAYASQTDHNDQAGFDGVHITYGWSSKTNDETEYHVELVRGNNFTQLIPEEVLDLSNEFVYTFTNSDGNVIEIPQASLQKTKRTIALDEDELTSLLDKVEKAWATTGHHNSYGAQHQRGTGSSPGGATSGKALPPASMLGEPSSIDLNSFLPKNNINVEVPALLQNYFFADDKIPDPRFNNVFIRVNNTLKGLEMCPLCSVVWAGQVDAISGYLEDRRQCFGCGVFLLFEKEDLLDMDMARTKNGFVSLEECLNMDLATIVWDFTDTKASKISYEILEVGDSKKV